MTQTNNPFDFTGKIALVTGGSRGLGREISLAFARHGADVIIASRKLDACEAVAAEVTALGRHALPVACHAGRWEDLARLAELAYKTFGKVDILVNNAGMSPISPSSLETEEKLFDSVLALNLKGPFRLSALIGSQMAAGDGGSIINIGSVGSIRPRPEYAPYAAAKAGLNAITTAHAFEFAPKVRVNAILPGSFRTDVAKHWPADKESKTDAVLGRFGEPEEITSTVLYLASPHSSFTTGAIIRVDGGRP